MVALFSARNDSAHLGKSIFSYNLVPAVRDLIRPGHQNHIIDPALLKHVKCIPDDRLFLQKEKLLLNLAFHPFSLSGCQNDSGGASRMQCNFLFPKLIQCMFHLVSPPCQNDLLKHSFSTFCQINILKKTNRKTILPEKICIISRPASNSAPHSDPSLRARPSYIHSTPPRRSSPHCPYRRSVTDGKTGCPPLYRPSPCPPGERS